MVTPLDVHHFPCEPLPSSCPTENAVLAYTTSHLYVAHSHCMWHTANPPCSPCLLHTIWYRASLQMKEMLGTRAGFQICPHQFCPPTTFSSVWRHTYTHTHARTHTHTHNENRNTPPPRCPTNNYVIKKYVRTGVFVGHAIRCAQEYCETAVTHPSAQDTQPIQSTKRRRPPICAFHGRSPCCGPTSCGKVEHARSCSWHGQKRQPDMAQGPLGFRPMMFSSAHIACSSSNSPLKVPLNPGMSHACEYAAPLVVQ